MLDLGRGWQYKLTVTQNKLHCLTDGIVEHNKKLFGEQKPVIIYIIYICHI